jgi:diadenylate cyclase
MQSLFARVNTFVSKYMYWLDPPKINGIDLVEIVIISFLIYNVMVWIKNTRAWVLFKGIVIIVLFCFIAAVFQMNTILWIVERTINVAFIAIVIVFQPELRRALEQLGRKNILTSIFSFESQKDQDQFDERCANEIIKATYEMAKVKTGALIVIERETILTEFERTGIMLDSLLSSQLLINIFEHNTPLHDGAIIVRGNRIVSATCYLPLSDNMNLGKELGTRHRAAVGVSEVSDALVVVVSEETGNVSVAASSNLFRNIDADNLRRKLGFMHKRAARLNRFTRWRRRNKSDKKNTSTSNK